MLERVAQGMAEGRVGEQLKESGPQLPARNRKCPAPNRISASAVTGAWTFQCLNAAWYVTGNDERVCFGYNWKSHMWAMQSVSRNRTPTSHPQ